MRALSLVIEQKHIYYYIYYYKKLINLHCLLHHHSKDIFQGEKFLAQHLLPRNRYSSC